MTASHIMDASEIDYKKHRFVIINGPSDANIDKFIQECKRFNVSDVVRVCEATYNVAPLEAAGVPVHDWYYEDGSPPTNKIVEDWLALLRDRVREKKMPESSVAVHCVAGLGRAPVLVAVALMELGMDYQEAVELIRSKRRGAINKKQLEYLGKYRSKSRLKVKSGGKCVIL